MRLAAATCLFFTVLFVGSAAAGEVDVEHKDDWSGVEYGGSLHDSKPGANGKGPGTRPSGSPGYPGYSPDLVQRDGAWCVTNRVTYYDERADAASHTAASEARWLTLLRNYPPCPDSPRRPRPAVPAVSYATRFWGEVLLPKPVPHIRPGYAITGMPAFLETGSEVRQTFTRQTPLGTLTLETSGAFRVDWGDGTRTGPHPYLGAPWPHGRITHGYTEVGTYRVVVTEEWSAVWRLAGESGRLDGLRTVGVIESLPVHEIQAVRNR
jgi:hypothetical protein